jgi:hypothetical protein
MSDDIRRLRREETFSIVPHWLLFSGVSEGAIRLYAVLWSFADRDGRNACPNRATLAAAVGKSAATVKRWTKELVDAGAIVVEARQTEIGDPDSNLYTLRTTPPNTRAGGGVTHEPTRVTHDPGVGSPVTRGGVTDEPRGGVTHDPQPIPNTTYTPSSSPQPPSSDSAPGSPVREGGGRGGGRPETSDPPKRGLGAAFVDDPEAFDAVWRWVRLKGQIPDDVTVGRWVPTARAFIDAGGRPDDAFLRRAHQAGKATPKGWFQMEGALHPHLGDLDDCADCGNRRLVGVLDDGALVPVDHPAAAEMLPCPTCRPVPVGAGERTT